MEDAIDATSHLDDWEAQMELYRSWQEEVSSSDNSEERQQNCKYCWNMVRCYCPRDDSDDENQEDTYSDTSLDSFLLDDGVEIVKEIITVKV